MRKICEKCKQEYEPSENVIRRLGLNGKQKKYVFYQGAGCNACKGTGYRGRLGIYEILRIDDKLKEMIIANYSADKILLMVSRASS